jgi:hypothetical protein
LCHVTSGDQETIQLSDFNQECRSTLSNEFYLAMSGRQFDRGRGRGRGDGGLAHRGRGRGRGGPPFQTPASDSQDSRGGRGGQGGGGRGGPGRGRGGPAEVEVFS